MDILHSSKASTRLILKYQAAVEGLHPVDPFKVGDFLKATQNTETYHIFRPLGYASFASGPYIKVKKLPTNPKDSLELDQIYFKTYEYPLHQKAQIVLQRKPQHPGSSTFNLHHMTYWVTWCLLFKKSKWTYRGR
jgi:hypothetical protein